MLDMVKLLQMQRDLQVESFDIDPVTLEGEARTEFIRWNVLALEDELHEMLNEVGWKPWATSRHVNEDEAASELVDALHFFLNLVLATAPRDSETVMVGHTLISKYGAKRLVNAKRQEDGYDGLQGKCPKCKRDILETARATDEGLVCPCGMLVWETEI